MTKYIKLWYNPVWLFIVAMVFTVKAVGQCISGIDTVAFQNADNMQWVEFVKKFKNPANHSMGKINILQIGDSHIQGGYFNNQVRKLMASDSINTSVGFTFPYSLAGTNGNDHIRYYSPNRWESKSAVNATSDKLSISGYLISSADSIIELTVKLNDPTDASRVNCIRIFHNSDKYVAYCDKTAQIIKGNLNDSVFFTDFILPVPSDSAYFQMIPLEKKTAGFQLFSLVLESSASDVVFHALGINGFSYEKYLARIDFMPWIKQIHPDCLIVSFGTNDIYPGVINEKTFSQSVSNLIDTLKQAFPDMVIIITSPGDHLRHKKYINPAISKAAENLYAIALKKDCLYWDFFSAMGGPGSSRQWFKNGWMYRDLVHLSKEGYKKQGTMFFDAFRNTLEKTWQNELLNAN